MVAHPGTGSLPRRTRAYVVEGAVLLLLGLGLPLLCVYHSRAAAALSFDRLAALPQGEAARELSERGSGTTAYFDGERADAQGSGIPPGVGVGMEPRFFNIGDGPGALYRGAHGTWYVLGRFRVLEYADGEWQTLSVVENQRYTYSPKERSQR